MLRKLWIIGLMLFFGAQEVNAQAVTGFRLWDAAADRPITSVAAPGATLTISDAQRSCVSVEIITDAYLNGLGPGSLRKSLDGVVGPKENSQPYAWEDDGGAVGVFNCAGSLYTPGRRVLTVEPFSGDDWTGTPGPVATVTLVTEGPPPPPPSCTPTTQTCTPTTGVGLECGATGSSWCLIVPPEDRNRTDLYWGMVSIPPTVFYGPSQSTIDANGNEILSWPVTPGFKGYYGAAWSCFFPDIYQSYLDNGILPAGTPQCMTSPPQLYGYSEGQPLPEPGVGFGLILGILFVAFLRYCIFDFMFKKKTNEFQCRCAGGNYRQCPCTIKE